MKALARATRNARSEMNGRREVSSQKKKKSSRIKQKGMHDCKAQQWGDALSSYFWLQS